MHRYDEKLGVMLADERQCVDCQRCVVMCPTRALKIVKSDNALKSNVNWTSAAMTEIYRQAQSGGVLLSSMGNPQPLPVYWDRLLINASQVTNPSIDPLREPMETRVYLGARPEGICRDANGDFIDDTPPQLKLEVPILFSGHELRLHQLQCPCQLSTGSGGAGHLLQHRRGRSASGFLSVRPAHDRAGCVGALWRASGLFECGCGH